jgi:apolipoprotein N-acyltransferase
VGFFSENFTSSIFPHKEKLLNKFLWIFLSLFSALLLNLSFPYPGYSWLAWISLVPFFIILFTEKLKRVTLSALITGVLFNVVYLDWMKEYKHVASLPGGVFAEMLFFLFATLLFWFLSRNLKSTWLRAFVCTAGWFVIDYLKTIGFLGFPWGIIGYSQYRNLLMIQNASVLGVWGIDFIILYCNVTIALLIVEIIRSSPPKPSPINLYILGGFLLLAVVFGVIKLGEEKKGEFRKVRAGVIQANFDPWSPQVEENLSKEFNLTMKALKYDPDLIVWSESSVPFPYEYYLKRGNTHAVKVHNFIRYVNRPFLFGSIEFDGTYENGEFRGDFYNVAIFYNQDALRTMYRKIHLVPFGEWFPFDRLFPFVERILEAAGAGDFKPGKEYVVFDAGEFRFSVLICFEDVFGNLTRGFIPGKPELFINVTNDAWTGSEKAEVQHFSLSVFRTVETRRSLLRVANGGVTACINPYGRVIDMLPLFTSDYLVCDVPLGDKDDKTFYTRFGDIFPQIAAIVICVFFLVTVLKKVIDRMKKKNNM